MAKSFEKLQEMYEKETELAEKHKKNAMDIKKEMEMQRNKESNKKIQALNLSGAEYDRFMKLLDADKKSVMEAADIVLKRREQEKERSGEVVTDAS